jgi:colicin import membrane protein
MKVTLKEEVKIMAGAVRLILMPIERYQTLIGLALIGAGAIGGGVAYGIAGTVEKITAGREKKIRKKEELAKKEQLVQIASKEAEEQLAYDIEEAIFNGQEAREAAERAKANLEETQRQLEREAAEEQERLAREKAARAAREKAEKIARDKEVKDQIARAYKEQYPEET